MNSENLTETAIHWCPWKMHAGKNCQSIVNVGAGGAGILPPSVEKYTMGPP